MTLSQRLISAVLLLVVLILAMGSVVAARSAINSIQLELEKNSRLGLDLFSIEVVNGQDSADSESIKDTLRQLHRLDRLKTLNVALTQRQQTLISFAPREDGLGGESVPDWFRELIAPLPKEYHRRIVLPGAQPITIRVIPDPTVEITKAWNNMLLFFMIALAFAVAAVPMIWLVIKLGLRPLDQVLRALEVVREGDFSQRLPLFRLSEINRLSQRFNNMTEVLGEQKIENNLLHQQLMEVQENERHYLARELHDELGQSINGIKSMAVSIEQRSPESLGAAREIRRVSDQMHNVVRNMINRLRPAVLDELGLRAALERLVDDWNSQHEDVFCSLNLMGSLDSAGESVSIAMYRIVQEALTNVAKHADASHVAVRVHTTSECFLLSITDNGKGIHEKENYRGRGLPGIKERVQAQGGSFAVDSVINEGVKITIRIPVRSSRDDNSK